MNVPVSVSQRISTLEVGGENVAEEGAGMGRNLFPSSSSESAGLAEYGKRWQTEVYSRIF